MIGDKICIRLINCKHEKKIIERNIADTDSAEDLVYSVLNDEGVGSVCRTLFALSLVDTGVWLAPNVRVRSFVIAWNNKGDPSREPKLEVRMRFRPSCFKLISRIDRAAFELIFAQIHEDFMKTRFNEEERDFVLLNESVLALVALNIVRHSVEQGINIDEILKQVKAKDIIPRRASRWQSALLFRLAKPMNLQEAIKIGYEQFNNDLTKIQRCFIELFLAQVAPDYQAEIYGIHLLTQTGTSQELAPQRIRVRYSQVSGESKCSVETSLLGAAPKRGAHRTCKRTQSRDSWHEICDIGTISHISLSTYDRRQAQIFGLKGEPIRLQFDTDIHARSFLSAIDGYQRLMRKWNYNLCREVYSPDLRQLERIGCHGPIGYGTSKQKLIEYRRQSCYLIRRCMEAFHHYLIDTLLINQILLTIDVEWNPTTKLFMKVSHSTNTKGLKLLVKTDLDEYGSLKALVDGIRIENDPGGVELLKSRHQLKHMIRPSETDDYPALTLSMSKKKLREQEQKGKIETKDDIDQLPAVIPQQFICYLGHRFPSAENGLIVELATLNRDRKVIVKNPCGTTSFSATNIGFAFHYCPGGHENLELTKGLQSSQMRVIDWTIVKSSLFAETIGCLLPGSVVQEYFPLGRLDTFMGQSNNTSQIVRLSASFQLAQALLFLYDKRIIHGKIRCRNIMVAQSQPIQIKLTDPMGSLNVEQDQAFIPPEFFSSNSQPCVRDFYTGIDVWAAGTTIWQIFNHGASPPAGRYASTLFQRECPDTVWSIIEACWTLEPNLRASPQILHRDLFDLVAWEEGAYDYLHMPNYDSSSDYQQSTLGADGPSTSEPLSLNTTVTSILNSPISTNSNGSQTDHLDQQYHGFFSSQTCLNSPGSSSGNESFLTSSRWINMINLRRGLKCNQFQGNQPPHECLDLEDIFGSSQSVSSASNSIIPNRSKATESTANIDLQSISDAFDRCVWNVNSSRLKLGAEIGRGASAVVIKGFMSQSGDQDQVVAVKCIEKDKSERVDPNSIDDLRREFDILKNLDHENIIKTLGYADDSHMMLIFEFMPLGSLLSCIRNLTCHEDLHKLPLQKYALDIANGMEYLESMKIVHRDLALRNILMKSRDEVKICDFGLARSLGTSDHYQLLTDRALPLKWYAPETLTSWVFTHKSDVWSYGVVLWEIYSCGDSPQYSGTYDNLSETLKRERLASPAGCPKHMYDLMHRCWRYDPHDRESFKNITLILRQMHNRLEDASIQVTE